MKRLVLVSTLLACSCFVAATQARVQDNGISLQGISLQGISLQGISLQGISLQGVDLNGAKVSGVDVEGVQIEKVVPLIGTPAKSTDRQDQHLTVPNGEHAEYETRLNTAS